MERKVYQKVTPQGQRTDAKNLKTNYWGDVLEMGDKLQISTGRIFFEQQTELVDYPANLFFFTSQVLHAHQGQPIIGI